MITPAQIAQHRRRIDIHCGDIGSRRVRSRSLETSMARIESRLDAAEHVRIIADDLAGLMAEQECQAGAYRAHRFAMSVIDRAPGVYGHLPAGSAERFDLPCPLN